MRTTLAEMKSSLSESNVLKQAANEKQKKLDTVNSQKKKLTYKALN